MRYSPIMPSIMIISMSGNMQFYPRIRGYIKIQSITKIFFINNLPYNNGVKVIISRETNDNNCKEMEFNAYF
jgi:hypothetical protein